MACKRAGEGEALQLNSWITAFSKAKFGFVLTSGTVIKYVPVVQQRCRKEGEGGGAPGVTSLGWHHIMKWNHISTDLWWRFFFRPHLNWKPTSLAAKTFFGFGIHIFLGWKNPLLWRQWLFFCRHLFLDRKGVTPRNSAPVPPSLATLLWYSTYIRTGGTVFICLVVVQYL